jgi:hypothetical protein
MADREEKVAINYHLKGGRPIFAAEHFTDAQRSIKLLASLFIASASVRRAAIFAQLFGFFLSFGAVRGSGCPWVDSPSARPSNRECGIIS